MSDLPDPGEDKDYCLFCGGVFKLDDLYVVYDNPKKKKGHIGNCCDTCNNHYAGKLLLPQNINPAVLKRNTADLVESLKDKNKKRYDRTMAKLKKKLIRK